MFLISIYLLLQRYCISHRLFSHYYTIGHLYEPWTIIFVSTSIDTFSSCTPFSSFLGGRSPWNVQLRIETGRHSSFRNYQDTFGLCKKLFVGWLSSWIWTKKLYHDSLSIILCIQACITPLASICCLSVTQWIVRCFGCDSIAWIRRRHHRSCLILCRGLMFRHG